ncbi:MAG TPA: hypothetical protein VLI54_01385 [Bacillota bacterium]|nr:hypothetical protein [Bacillota bacterium]
MISTVTTAESSYREHLAQQSPLLTSALEAAIPVDPSADDPASRLARGLCFMPSCIEDTERPPFSIARQSMMDHGVRQAALAAEICTDDEISRSLPTWFDPRLFGQLLITADVGLAFVPDTEVETIDTYGPKYAVNYEGHPEWGYRMAENISDLPDASSRILACAIGRHHKVQARHPYGLEWDQMRHHGIDTVGVDMLIAIQKPLDYFDDFFTRRGVEPGQYAARIAHPLRRFSLSIGAMLSRNLLLVGAAEARGFDLELPLKIAAKIQDVLLDDTSAIADVYRNLHAAA